MPNYGLVIDSTYNPISYEQYVAPFIQYAEVYNKIADQYDALEMEANKWEKLANSSIDQKEYDQYQSYARKLRAAAEDLAENGLSSRTRSTLSSLRGEYSKTIQPISDAWDLREKERELQRQALLQNPDIMFSRDAANTRLSAYMSGTPALQTYNGARLYEYTSKAVEQLAQAAREDLMENGANSEWYKILGGQYYQKDNYRGVTADVIMQSMFDANGDIRPEANKYLKAIGEGAIELSGMRNWSNWNDVASRAYNYINQGLWGAIGTEEEKQLSSKYYDYMLKKHDASHSKTIETTSKPVERTTTILTDENPKITKQYSKIYNKYKEELSEDIKNLRGVSTVSELMKSYYEFINDYNSSTQELEQQLQSSGITNIYKKYGGNWLIPDISLTEQEEEALIQQVRAKKDYKGYSDRIVKGDDYYRALKQQLLNKKWSENKDLIESLRSQYEQKEYFDNDVKKYKLSDEEKQVLEQLGITEEDFYTNPKAVDDLIFESTLTYLNATNDAGQDFKQDILGTVRRNTLGKTNVEVYKIRTKNGSKDKVKDKNIQSLLANDNIEAIMLDPTTLKNNELTIQDIEGNYYSIPLEYLGSNVLQALTSPTFTVKINNEDKSISLLDYWKLAINKKKYNLAHEIEVQIADVISGEFNYNFYQKQGDTQKE